jgi:hypothetical protein
MMGWRPAHNISTHTYMYTCIWGSCQIYTLMQLQHLPCRRAWGVDTSLMGAGTDGVKVCRPTWGETVVCCRLISFKLSHYNVLIKY